METKANYVLVGVFTLVICALAFAFVYWIARYGDRSETATLEIRILGSVTGLSEGSQVLFNGIKVGTVKKLSIDDNNPDAVIAQTEVNATTPITRSTQATLGFAGLTGQAFIELKGGKLNEPNLLEEAAKDEQIARMDADPSVVNNLLQKAQTILERVDGAVSSIESFITEVKGPLVDTVNNTKKFTDALAKNSEVIDKFSQSAEDVQAVVKEAREMMAKLNTASTRVDGVLAKLDTQLSDQDGSVVREARETMKSYRAVADNLNARLGPITDNINRFSGQGLRDVQSLVNESRQSVQRIERAITDLEKNPQRVIFGGSGSVPEYDGRTRR
ncbi:phospholipid/cholesterol/gamma-HCH transport system substrate-binding protein [Phyllobacterium sp. YR620]|uniref:MCE family protein n=1 Tax=Phyllobacterium pellucidum TaxID=2740464 RepID=A0A849VTR8_9HYPH|nr:MULTISPECIES: MlaD family protein [Phyllobacterium]MRG57109.1 MCE family protein [Phyllobacterium sp. SYP-B3895]NTS31537.1 MCE family protein [Phyllobacterium pellucidum]UGY09005.1 MCE family protein [Phyllobacterium sp. T1018]SDP02129.1 phospholipid/cholesterol/gamma-HCH transport system substrate-binding protein [Phyllobacterium sp. YR620]SFI97764.1 phospholipid/cholesterol/gamma-HCH transport system substrate-binding protein [Phyllobacterium sp. CL33Tsu]